MQSDKFASQFRMVNVSPDGSSTHGVFIFVAHFDLDGCRTPDTGEIWRLGVQTDFRVGNNTAITLPCDVTVGLCRRQSEVPQITETLVRAIHVELTPCPAHLPRP